MSVTSTIRRTSLLVSALAVCCVVMAGSASAQTFTTLFEFNFTNGTEPLGQLVQAGDGIIYGTTLEGGPSGAQGTLYQIDLDDSVTTLHNFCTTEPACKDGGNPRQLAVGKDGNIYGVTQAVGTHNDGTVFKITPDGVLSVIHNFATTEGTFPNGIIRAGDGNFYGTMMQGGAHNGGTIFRVTPSGQVRLLHQFCEQQACTDGAFPSANLVQGRDGNLYGEAMQGPNQKAGVIFKITRNGVYSVLHNFCSLTNCADGQIVFPDTLVRGRDGNLYGSTALGGTGKCISGCGTFFKITLDGVLTTLRNFQPGEVSPPSSLLQASDGNFYGLSFSGSDSVIVRITPQGTLTPLLTIPGGLVQGTSLIQALNGDFYGTTLLGGSTHSGTVFRFSLQ